MSTAPCLEDVCNAPLHVDCETIWGHKPLHPGGKEFRDYQNPERPQHEEVCASVNLAVNREVAVCNLDECHWEYSVWNLFTPALAKHVLLKKDEDTSRDEGLKGRRG